MTRLMNDALFIQHLFIHSSFISQGMKGDIEELENLRDTYMTKNQEQVKKKI